MAVPAHDERDHEFAKTFGLEIIPVLAGGNVEESAYTEDGLHINSDFLDGLDKETAIEKMVAWLEENHVGKKEVSYRLRDWLFSRQRYWGNQSQSSIGKMGRLRRFLKISCRCVCQKPTISNQAVLVNRH